MNKTVVVTGGAQGIGKALSQRLLLQGCQVCILDIDDIAGEKTQRELSAEVKDGSISFFKCDVRNEREFRDAVTRCIECMGHIDVFVNNAGIVNEFNPDLCVDINLKAVIRGTDIAREHMRVDTGGLGGQIINVSSMAGLVVIAAFPVYCATKSGVLSYTKACATQASVADIGITCTCICPGFTKTTMVENLKDKVLDVEACQKLLDTYGLLELETVVNAFIQIIMDKKNGGVLKVSVKGTEYLE